MDLSAFEELIRRRAGIDIRGPAERLLQDSLASRIKATAAGDGHEYYLKILADEGEFFHLVELVAINETYFCRDCPQLTFFAQVLVPRLLASRAKRPVKILSAGCSSGEEVYSIGIVLAEAYGDEAATLFSISGCDIDRDALDAARSGLYRPFSFRGAYAARRDRWFEPAGTSLWRIKDEIARMADFRHVNLMGDDWPADLVDVDAVFFRNVSIYFDPETRMKMHRRLASIMRPGAFLITGSAETLANDLGLFELRSEADNFYFQNRGGKEERAHPDAKMAGVEGNRPPRTAFATGAKILSTCPQPLVHEPGLGPKSRHPGPHERPTGEVAKVAAKPVQGLAPAQSPTPAPGPALGELRTMVRDKRYDEVLAATSSIERETADETARRLLRSFVLLERRRPEEAERLAMQALEADPWSPDACVLLALAARRDGRTQDAIDWFRRAVYADNGCWAAHYYLGELYRERGERNRAGREFTIVLRTLEKPSTRAGARIESLAGARVEAQAGARIDTSAAAWAEAPVEALAVVPLGLPAADLRLICERRLAEAME